MLTGIRPSSTRFVTFESASEQTPQAVTLPQQFKNNGYYTVSLGKIFNNLGDILAELEALDLAEDTIIVLWGDHGWSLGEHTQWAKHSSFNVANQIPLIIRTPDDMSSAARGAMADGLVESVDIYPTLTELAGPDTPNHTQGGSFRALLEDPKLPGKTAVFPRWKIADSSRTDRYFYAE
jgi:arylsulfatase A-like enzyme